MATKAVEVLLEPIMLKTMKVKIVGKTPLLMDKFPEETKLQILDKQTGVSKGNKKKTRNIKKEAEEAVHKTSKGKIGTPAYGIKKAMMECTSFVGDKMFSKKLISGAVQITNQVEGLLPIKFKKRDILKHSIDAQTKFSPQFHDWSCDIEFVYDANNIAPTDILTLLNYAGFYQGCGAWRPKGKGGGSGSFGMYEVKLN